MREHLTQPELEQLSAFFDGELPADQAEAFERRLEAEPRLQRALAQMKALDAALDAWQVPAAAADLPERVLASVRRKTRQSPVILRLVRWAGAAAAAAAVIVGAIRWMGPKDTPRDAGQVVQNEPAVEDALIVRHLDFFENYEVLANLETLEAIEQIEDGEGGAIE